MIYIMKDYILDNGLKLIYKKSNSELSSIAISLDAGATRDGKVLGVAHVTEHMVYKGTEIRSEQQINEELSKVFWIPKCNDQLSICSFLWNITK